MNSATDRLPTKSSNRLSHGLSSKAKRESWFDDVEHLVDELIGDSPRTEYLVQTAMQVAHTMVLLQSISAEKRRILSTPPPPPHYQQFLDGDDFEEFRLEVIESGFCRDLPSGRWAQFLKDIVQYPDQLAAYKPSAKDLPNLIYKRKDELRRIDEYERKALSRLKKQITWLDYVRLEIKRQKHAELIKQLRGRMSQT